MPSDHQQAKPSEWCGLAPSLPCDPRLCHEQGCNLATPSQPSEAQQAIDQRVSDEAVREALEAVMDDITALVRLAPVDDRPHPRGDCYCDLCNAWEAAQDIGAHLAAIEAAISHTQTTERR